MKAAVIGAGEIGRAVGYLLDKNGVSHLFWDKDPALATGELDEVLMGVDMVFFCVPSWTLREALSSVKQKLTSKEILVFISKGLEPETGMNAVEIASDVSPECGTVFVGGPMIAEEIISGKGGAGVIAASDSLIADEVRQALSSEEFSAHISSDIQGAALSGVLKNIYAILMGASEGIGRGVNIKGLIITKALVEMGQVIEVLGGKKETVYGLSGLGDLFATGSGSFSSNWKAGFSLAKGERPEKISEGMSSISGLQKRIGSALPRFKLLSAAADIVEGPDPKMSLEKILND